MKLLKEEDDIRFGSGQIRRRAPNSRSAPTREKRGNSWQRECRHGDVEGEKLREQRIMQCS